MTQVSEPFAPAGRTFCDALPRCPPPTKLCVVPLSFERVFLRTGQMFGDVRGRDLCRTLSQGRPVCWMCLTKPGPYMLTSVPGGSYYALAVAFPAANYPQVYLLPDQRLLIGVSQGMLAGQYDFSGAARRMDAGVEELQIPPASFFCWRYL